MDVLVAAVEGVFAWDCDGVIMDDALAFVPFLRVEPFVVVRQDPEEVTEGGIIVPDSAQRSSSVGWVLMAGADVGCPVADPKLLTVPVTDPLDLVGQKVLWGSYMGSNIKTTPYQEEYEGKYLMMTEWDLWGAVYDTEETLQ